MTSLRAVTMQKDDLTRRRRVSSGTRCCRTTRDTASVEAFLDLARSLPHRTCETGETLLADGDADTRLYILVEGALRVEKHGAPIAIITEPGVCVGEVALLLDVPVTADVVVSEPTVVAVVDDAGRLLADHPELVLALARLLAGRLQRMTTYLADLQNQYADHDGGLGMVDAVLGTLMHHSGPRSDLGSERDPQPEY